MKLLFLILSVLFVSACSSTPSNTRIVEVTGMVISSEEAPLVCNSSDGNRTSPLFATLIGGLIGNQFGGGTGRTVATVVGSGAGYKYASRRNSGQGSNQRCRTDGWVSQMRYKNPVNGYQERTIIKTDNKLRAGQRVRTNVRIAN